MGGFSADAKEHSSAGGGHDEGGGSTAPFPQPQEHTRQIAAWCSGFPTVPSAQPGHVREVLWFELPQ